MALYAADLSNRALRGNHLRSDTGTVFSGNEWMQAPEIQGSNQRRWFAAYTTSRHEKRVSEHCRQVEIEHFLPVFHSRKTWKNRVTAVIETPLFPNYIFVRLEQRDHARLLRLPGVLSTVGSSQAGPAAIADEEIEDLRRIVLHRAVEPHPNVNAGDSVRIRVGPLAGLTGVVLRKNNGLRFIVSLDAIRKSVAVEIDGSELEPYLVSDIHPRPATGSCMARASV
jgi:transcription antitermination factor NusG